VSIDLHPSSRRVMINTISGVATTVAALLIAVLTTPILIHLLGETGFGLFAVIGALAAYAGLLDFGIGPGLVKHFAEHDAVGDDGGVRQVATIALLFYLIIAAVFGPLLFWAAPALVQLLNVPAPMRHDAELSLMLMFGYFIASSVGGVFIARLVSWHQMDRASLIRFGGQVVFGLLVVAVLPHRPTVPTAIGFNLLQALLVAVVACVTVAAKQGNFRLFSSPWRIDRSLARKLFGFGGWMQITSLADVVKLETDKLIISGFLNLATVTPYEIGSRLASLNRILPLQLLAALMPSATLVHMSGGKDDLERYYAANSRYLMTATLALTGFIVVAADPLITVWLGRSYPMAAAVAIALAMSGAVHNMTGVGTTMVRAAGQPRQESSYAALSMVLNVALTIVLAPRFGLMGVVAGTVIATLVGSLYFLLSFHLSRGFSWRRSFGSWLWRLLGATGLAMLASAAVKLGLPVTAASGRMTGLAVIVVYGATYGAVLFSALTMLRFWLGDERAFVGRLLFRPRGGNLDGQA
jgi:O-antigen/teichoic acid export membrane protein